MEVRSPHSTREADTSAIVQRVQAILDHEIAGGALANVAASTRKRSDHPFGLGLPEVTRQLAAEFGGLLETVLDLLAPLPQSAVVRPAADQDRPQGVQQIVEPVPVLRARRCVPPGAVSMRPASGSSPLVYECRPVHRRTSPSGSTCRTTRPPGCTTRCSRPASEQDCAPS
jgi:hypothetical protein